MKRCFALAVLGLFLFSSSAFAQARTRPVVCHWCKRGGKDIKWVKLIWFKYDKQSKPPKLIDLDKDSVYKEYRLPDDKKRHETDVELLRDSLGEIYEGSGDKAKCDAHYFICYHHFDRKAAGSGGESGIPIDQGRKHEKGEPCRHVSEGKTCERLGYRKFRKVRGGKVMDAIWYCPVHFAAAAAQKKQMPLFIFGGVAAVLLLGLGLGIVGIKIGDKERALDESGGGKRR